MWTYVDGDRFFCRLGPVKPGSVSIDLKTDNGDTSDYDGLDAELHIYDDSTLSVSYTGSVSGNVMSLTLTDDLPESAGLYEAELRLGDDAVFGWFENIKSPSDRDVNIVMTRDVERFIGRWPVQVPANLSGDDFEAWTLAQGIWDAVEEWNDHPEATSYTPISFPHHRPLLEGAAAFAMQMTGRALQRERMPVSAGPVQADQLARADLYLSEGARGLQRYREWVDFMTTREALSNGWGTY